MQLVSAIKRTIFRARKLAWLLPFTPAVPFLFFFFTPPVVYVCLFMSLNDFISAVCGIKRLSLQISR